MLLETAFNAYQTLTKLQEGAGQEMNMKIIGEMSDLYIQEGAEMQFCIPIGLHKFGQIVSRDDIYKTFSPLIKDFETRIEQHGRIEEAYNMPIQYSVPSEIKGEPPQLVDTVTRVRITVYKHNCGELLGAVVRFSPERPVPLKELHLGQMAAGLLRDLRGAILVTGPTHSGKTHTMSSIIDQINRSEEGHIVTIEDPIEIRIPQERCVVSQLEVGNDIPTYAEGVNGSMRMHPIAVMVGEIRDTKTAQAALRVVQGGHFLVAGMHGPDSVTALQAYCSYLDPQRLDQERRQLANRLNGVIYQVLVRSLDGLTYCVACEVISFLDNPSLRLKLASGDFEGLAAAITAQEKGTLSLNSSLIQLLTEKKITYRDAKKATYAYGELHQMATKAGLVTAS